MTSYKLSHFKCVYIFSVVVVLLFVILLYISNNRKIVADDVEGIIFSAESGFYDNEFDLTISATGGTIYYTLDGSTPTYSSIKYEGPIHIFDATENENIYSAIADVSVGLNKDFLEQYNLSDPLYKIPSFNVDKCTVVRAVVYYGNEEYSEVKTASYFVDFGNKAGYEGMNTVSIVTDPDNLFSYENGIYITGKYYDDCLPSWIAKEDRQNWWWVKGNYFLTGPETERSVSCQFFDSNGELILSQSCGIRIHGGVSRSFNPKSLNLYARTEYNGQDYFYYDFFGNEYYPSSMVLTQGGNDCDSKLQDYIMHKLASELDVSTMDFIPYVMFLDGEYWGVYWLTEKYDKEYVHFHYGVDSDNVIMIKNGELEEGVESDLELYNGMLDFCSNADMSDYSNYEKACDLIDMDSFIDYYASLIYISRYIDWPWNNYALWRSRKTGISEYDDGKWRWMLFDINSGGMTEDLYDYDSIEYAMDNSAMFANLMNNDEFRNRFLDRTIELSETVFEPDHVQIEIDEFRKLMDIPMEKDIERFYGDDFYYLYTDKVNSVSNFFVKREEMITEIVEEYR